MIINTNQHFEAYSFSKKNTCINTYCQSQRKKTFISMMKFIENTDLNHKYFSSEKNLIKLNKKNIDQIKTFLLF